MWPTGRDGQVIYLAYIALVLAGVAAGVVVWMIGACQGTTDALKNWL